jgi:hypothetical protein
VYLPDDPAKFARVAGKPTVPPATGWLFMLAFVSAALSAGAALIHRYTSVDSLACHLRAVRLRIRNRPERTERAPSENQERKRPGGEWLSRLGRWFAAVPDTTSSNSDPSDLALAQEQERQRYARFTWSARLLRLSAWLLLFGLLFFCLSLAIFMINAPGVLDHKGPGLTNETSIDEPGTAW